MRVMNKDQVPCLCVQRSGDRWGVTQKGRDQFLAEFTLWQDAVDYARGLAVQNQNCLVEGEDSRGRLILRQIFSTDAAGVVCVRSIN
jgi:hypothetical protein